MKGNLYDLSGLYDKVSLISRTIIMDCEAVCPCSCKIAQLDKNTLVITQIPFSTNTTTLIDSILKANDKGIKIKN
jgi:hypothetical protein